MPGIRSLPPSRPLYRKLAVLTEGTRDIYRNKTALGLLRFRPEDVVCVIDSANVGADLGQLLGISAKIPVVGSIADAAALEESNSEEVFAWCLLLPRSSRTLRAHPLVGMKSFVHPNAESAVSDLAPSRPEGTLSQVRYRALGVSAIETKRNEARPNQPSSEPTQNHER
jgi:hypothetical protein